MGYLGDEGAGNTKGKAISKEYTKTLSREVPFVFQELSPTINRVHPILLLKKTDIDKGGLRTPPASLLPKQSLFLKKEVGTDPDLRHSTDSTNPETGPISKMNIIASRSLL